MLCSSLGNLLCELLLPDELNNLMTRDMSAARVAPLFREPEIRSPRDLSGAPKNKESTPAQELYIARQREVISLLMAAIARTPLASKAREKLEADLSYAQSLRPEQLTPEFFNSSFEEARDVLADGELDGETETETEAEELAHYYHEMQENIRRQAYWDDYYETDFNDNLFTDNGYVNNIDGFAKHYGFDANFLNATNEPFKNDPAIHNNAAMLGFRGAAAQTNQAYRENPGKTPADVAGNDHVALMGALKYGSREAIDKALKTLETSYGYDEKTGAKSLDPAVKADFYRLRSLIREGHLSPEEIQAAFDKKSFNNPDFIKATIEAGEVRRMAATKAASAFIPDHIKEKVLEEAKAKGIDISQPFEKVMEEARKAARTPDGSDTPYNDQNSSIRAALSAAKGAIEDHRGTQIFGDVVKLMDKNLTPEERDRLYYNKSPEERLKLFEDLYHKENGQPMPTAVRNVVKYNIDHIRTQAETGAFIAANELAAKENSPKSVVNYYTHQAEKVLAEKASNGDSAASKDLNNLQAIDKHLEVVSKDNPELAERLREKILITGYNQVAQGRVDYREISKVIQKETAAFLAEKERQAAEGQISEKVYDRAKSAAISSGNLDKGVQDTRGIKMPVSDTTTVSPPPPLTASANGRVAGRV